MSYNVGMADIKIPLQLMTPGKVKRLLAERVREARLARGWRQSSLAKMAGISLPTLSRYERTGGTSLENFLKISHALGGLDGFGELLKPARARSVAELEKQLEVKRPRRGRK